MHLIRGVTAGLVAITALTFVPVAEALPPIRVRVPHIDVPTSSVRPLTEEQWSAGTRAYEQRLAELGGSEEALGVQETLLQIRARRALDEMDACLTGAGQGVVDGSFQAYVDSGEFADVNGVVSSVIGGCLDERVPGYVPAEAREAVADALAEQVVTAVSGVDAGSSTPVNVPIDWPEVSYEPASETGSGGFTPSSDSDGGGDGGGSLVPAIVGIGSIGLLLLLVRAVRRRV